MELKDVALPIALHVLYTKDLSVVKSLSHCHHNQLQLLSFWICKHVLTSTVHYRPHVMLHW